ncbi:serine hydrolase domain-containing protein [Aquimarina litoralis]|uniref:serine hydrolase domain-containing protein n=1 Tax=Aquimarina litoralis TaxID=584605 RepID=UPI001C57554B|nr:serine hydrolase domain-containing protein [Aquimarina litoralis]MBW1296627.1 serine hydrolase [Aquimarina litoralis]
MRFIIITTLFYLACIQSTLGQSTATKITNELQRHFEESNLPGFCISIVNHKGILYKKGFGYSDVTSKTAFTEHTVQNVGSVSKAILGVVLAKTMEKYELTYDDKINDYLPFKVSNPYYKNEEIRIKHIATHTSTILDTKHYEKSYIAEEFQPHKEIHKGYANFLKSHKTMSLESFLFKIISPDGNWYKKKNFIRAKPGKQSEYANLNASLAALVIEKATNHSLEDLSKKLLFAPLKLNSTTWNFTSVDKNKLATRYFPSGKIVPNYSLITYPDGGLYSNVKDLSVLLQELIKAFNKNSIFLPPKYASVLLPGDKDNQRLFIGMGKKSKNIGHSGSDPGIQADVQFNANNKIGRVILTNVNAADNEKLYREYRKIHDIIAKYETQLTN